MSAHIRNLKLKSFKLHCFRSVSQVVSHEKPDDCASTKIMNQYLATSQSELHLRRYPPLTNFFRTTSYRDKPKLLRDLEGYLVPWEISVRFPLLNSPNGNCVKYADIPDSKIFSDIIWHVRKPKHSVLYYRPVTTSVCDLPLLASGDTLKNAEAEKIVNYDSKTTKLCYNRNDFVLGHQIRKDLDFIIHRQDKLDHLKLSDSRIHPDGKHSDIGSAGEYIPGFFNLERTFTDSKGKFVEHSGGKPDSLINNWNKECVNDNVLHEKAERTKIYNNKVEEDKASAVWNYSVTDPSDWTLYYCFQGDGKAPQKEPVDRGLFPKGKPSMSTLEEVRDDIENEITYFLAPGPLNYRDMRTLHYDDVIFVNNYWEQRKTTQGFNKYVSQLALYRMVIKLRYTWHQMEALSILTDYDKGSIKVHWRAYCLGYFYMYNFKKFTPFQLKSYTEEGRKDKSVWIEGMCTFYCGEDGRIYKHYLDRTVPEDKTYSVFKTVRQKVAIALGLMPKPLAESRQNNLIT